VTAWRRHDPWLARWLFLALGFGLVSAAIVQTFGLTKLALLFPWRISVFLVPISATVLIVEAAVIAGQRAVDLLRWPLVALAVAFAFIGSAGSLLSTSPATSDPATVLVRASRVSGVGLIPLELENVRLNAAVPIYVDWKTTPYLSGDLIEWWKRIDQVKAFTENTETFCAAAWSAGIDWIMLASEQHVPSCVAEWPVAGESQQWRILTRPRT
jgi:hypothetical protein